MDAEWEQRVAEAWAAAAELEDAELVARFEALAAERPAGDAAALFELAGAHDSTGDEKGAEALYRQAMAAGLDNVRLPQAVIQFGSTLRNNGRYEESIELIGDWLIDNHEHEYADAARAFLALSLVSAGRPVDATKIALDGLLGHMPRYHRSLRAYIAEL